MRLLCKAAGLAWSADILAVRAAAVQVLLDGKPLGRLDRNGPANLTIRGSALPGLDQVAELSIVAEAVGRANEGWRFDVKGLASPLVTLDGELLRPLVLLSDMQAWSASQAGHASACC